ncbi:MAG: hypothetical protein AMXMBFR7_38160 [Planctomycetota bacterium]
MGYVQSMPHARRTWIVSVSAVLLAFGLAGLHHVLGRPDRIAAAEDEARLRMVGDEVLRWELEHGELPDRLDELVPSYLRADQLERDGQAFYRYEPEHRLLEQARGAVVRGLFSVVREPLRYALPPRQEAVRHPEVSAPVVPASATGLRFADLTVPDLPAPAEGAYVFEAEHFTDTNYGWEAHPDPACAGGAYLHCKEGIANGPGQTRHNVGDFYALHATTDYTYLRYHFHLPQAGRFYLYARMWTTDTTCSNHLCCEIDSGGPDSGGLDNRAPFRWLWSGIRDEARDLAAGDHFIHIFIHEDGIRLDQFVLSPVPLKLEDERFRSNFAPGDGTAWSKQAGPVVHVSFDLQSMVVTAAAPPECRLVLRRLRASEGKAQLVVTLRDAEPSGKAQILAQGPLDWKAVGKLAFLPISLAQVDWAARPRREYALEATITQEGREPVRAAVPLMHPWAWEVFGPGGYLGNDSPGPLDMDGLPKPGDERRWEPFAPASFDHFGVLDFGMHTTGNAKHPPTQKTIYARTRLQVAQTGEYLFKVQADDQMLLWLDGREIYRHDHTRPVTRAAYTFKLALEAGEHRLRMRVNQQEGRWQASLRIRTPDDDLSTVSGIEPPHAP